MSSWIKKTVCGAAGLLCGMGFAVAASAEPAGFHLIPKPQHLQAGEGELPLDAKTRIVLSDPGNAELMAIAERWAAPLRRASGLPLLIADQAAGKRASGEIHFKLDAAAAGGAEEGYTLRIDKDGVTLAAARPAGLFYGAWTLSQLLPPEVLGDGVLGDGVAADAVWTLPAVEITDAPRFPYRGMHLDVARHMFPVAFVKRYIDLLAMYKMNTFHWHLTEDQGWRIEIKKYPKLTEISAFRKETQVKKQRRPFVGDGKRYGGFYTQDEVREVVAYAAERYVTVIPEIEMPGHSTAVLAAYPELGCTEGPFEVAMTWGVFEDIYCPSEETFQFLENVLTEVMELFPSRYIHIGGDEAPKTAWEKSELAQAVIEREGLKDEHELQSYFIRRIEAFLLKNGRRLVGWDEILEGGLAPEATVMSWRGMEGGIAAAREGHDVIMTPTSHVYFDYYQAEKSKEPLAIGGLTPLEKVYDFEPVPAELTAEEGKHVLGAQGNVWTEYMKTTEYVEYMVFPRLLALAEVVWSPRQERNWMDFKRRLPEQLERLGQLGVNYRPLD
jgi:hexosaminidase